MKKLEITGKPKVLKELNMSLIKDVLSKKGHATRVEIAEITGISQPTVNQLIKGLLETETVINVGEANSTGGRRAEVYALNTKKSKLALIKIHDNYFETFVTDMELREEQHGKQKRNYKNSMHMQLEKLIQKIIANEPCIQAVSIGIPGAVLTDGTVFAIPSVPEWEYFPLSNWLGERVCMPVRVTNDINASAIGYAGENPNVFNMIYLHTDGKGIGAGICLNGKLYTGIGSFAGELGYMQLGKQSVEELMHDGKTSLVSIIAQITINLICMFNPEKIIFSGHLNLDELIIEVEEACEKVLPKTVIPKYAKVEAGAVYYYKGLGRIGLEALNNDIRIL